MRALEELGRALEHYAMNNRGCDAMELASFIDDLIKERIAEALRPAPQHSGTQSK